VRAATNNVFYGHLELVSVRAAVMAFILCSHVLQNFANDRNLIKLSVDGYHLVILLWNHKFYLVVTDWTLTRVL
jgi:hypothetical protein